MGDEGINGKEGCHKKKNDLRVRSIPMIHQHASLVNINLRNINILAFWRPCELRVEGEYSHEIVYHVFIES